MAFNGMKPGWQVVQGQYATSAAHAFVGVEDYPGFFSMKNIGDNGENLTIAVLSMNRAALTIRLYRSILEQIPDFRGQLLIGDNGSSKEELAKLHTAFSYAPFKTRILEFGQNYGVAGGRNKLFAAVETDWLMSLDNDLYFTSNPLLQAQKDINALGVQFLAMPLLDKGDCNSGIYGGNLYLEPKDGKPSVGVGSAYQIRREFANKPMDGFLCTGLPGGAAILNKATFLQAGGFEGNMFVGFEDTEFSVRLFQKGYKVGSCGMISLEHDHPKVEAAADRKYEQTRFSNKRLLESARYFEQKHGFYVWNAAVAEWVEMRQQQVIGANPAKNVSEKRKRIALVIDQPNWALDHVADQIIKNLSDEFDFSRIYGVDIDNFTDVVILAEKCDIVHVLWRGHLASFNGQYCQQRIRNLGLSREEFMKRYVEGKVISTEVYDHLLLEGPESDFTPKLFVDDDAICTNYAVSSKKLWEIYTTRPGLRLRPQAICQDGVDLSLFRPERLERFENVNKRTVRFGWVGNSKWMTGDLKGINTIIKPAIEELQADGYDVELITSDRLNKLIPHEEMPNFYNQIDCYICASVSEGTPNPVLESMACGVPVISTDVGLIPEVFGPKQMKYVLEERSVECLKKKMKQLIDTAGSFRELSGENLISIQEWDWKIKAENIRDYFRGCLNGQKF